MLKIEVGIFPDKLLKLIAKISKFERAPISSGISPAKSNKNSRIIGSASRNESFLFFSKGDKEHNHKMVFICKLAQ